MGDERLRTARDMLGAGASDEAVEAKTGASLREIIHLRAAAAAAPLPAPLRGGWEGSQPPTAPDFNLARNPI